MTEGDNNRGKLVGMLLLWMSVLATQAICQAQDRVIDHQSGLNTAADKVLDVRPLSNCMGASLPEARCLPAEDFLGGHRRLANVSGILWLLGTVGLSGSEHVLVVGDDRDRKAFVAGLLYLAGQQRISILDEAIAEVPGVERLNPGRARSAIREVVFQAPMRGDRLIMRGELKRQLHSRAAPVLLDGRTEQEYWGRRIRSSRGGHIPGAQHLPAAAVGGANATDFALPSAPFPELPVAYGHDTYEGLIYLSRLVGNGIDARVLLEGWSGWAADGSLPVDSSTYPANSYEHPRAKSAADVRQLVPFSLLAGAMLTGAALTAGGMWVGRLIVNSRRSA